MKAIAIIPARGNSKGIPSKNMQALGGKPLLGWTLEAALDSALIDKVLVSTESDRISQWVTDTYPDVIVHHRDAWLSGDEIHATAVVSSCIGYADGYDALLMLLPTSPFRTTENINEALSLLSDQYDSVVGVSEVGVPLIRLREIRSRYLVPVRGLAPDELVRNRQLCDPLYVVNGAMFVCWLVHFQRHHSFHVGHVRAYIMTPEEGLDIDTPEDLEGARRIVRDQIGRAHV